MDTKSILDLIISKRDIRSSPNGNFNDCWWWTGPYFKGRRNKIGYARCCIGKEDIVIHRFIASIFLNFDLNSDLQVLHKCDNPLCFNPDHLFIGNHKDNMKDKVSKNRQHRPKGELNGRVKLTQEQVDEIRSKYKNEKIRKVDLATQYGIKQMQVSRIIRGESWKI